MKKSACTSFLAGGALLLVLSSCEPDNLGPVANAGPDLVVVPPDNMAELKGSATDPDGTVVRYEWTMVSGPAASTLVQPSAAATWVEGLVEGTYVFELRVTDNDDLSDTDRVTVWVGDPCYGCWDY
jgi:hypothetical protein